MSRDCASRLDWLTAWTYRSIENSTCVLKSPVRDPIGELKVGGAKIRDQRRDDYFLSPLVGQKIGSCCLRSAAIFSPEIQILPIKAPGLSVKGTA
jgi:hypothetical protein